MIGCRWATVWRRSPRRRLSGHSIWLLVAVLFGTTKGWTLEEYRFAVREALGDVPIVETTEERQIIPLLREALGLPKLS